LKLLSDEQPVKAALGEAGRNGVWKIHKRIHSSGAGDATGDSEEVQQQGRPVLVPGEQMCKWIHPTTNPFDFSSSFCQPTKDAAWNICKG